MTRCCGSETTRAYGNPTLFAGLDGAYGRSKQ